MPGYGHDPYGDDYGSVETRAEWIPPSLDDEINNDWVGPYAFGVEWEGYSPRPDESDADVTVSTTSELYSEIGTAGRTIYLADDVTFNVDNQDGAQGIAQGVTLTSDGATIQASAPKRPIFYLTNDGVRISGIRFEGEEPTPSLSNPPSGASITSRAIVIQAGNCEIDNCEVYGFTNAGIYVGWNENNPPRTVEPSIHHNVVRDNLYDSLGYGIVVYSGLPQIEYTYINGCRHGVGAGGRDACSYIFRNNIHGEDTLVFQTEMHEHPDYEGSSGIGATIKNNEFRAIDRPNGNTARAYAQRGTPQELTRFDNNWTWNPNGPDPNAPGASSSAVSQTNHGSSDWQNVEWSWNHHGQSDPSNANIGVQPLEDLTKPAPGEYDSPTGVFEGFDGVTDSTGSVLTDVPDGDYIVTATHPDTGEIVEETVSVTGSDVEVVLQFTGS